METQDTQDVVNVARKKLSELEEKVRLLEHKIKVKNQRISILEAKLHSIKVPCDTCGAVTPIEDLSCNNCLNQVIEYSEKLQERLRMEGVYMGGSPYDD